MRGIAIISSLLAVAACSEPAPKEESAAEIPNSLQAGQWEITTEVTDVTAADSGQPPVKAGPPVTKSLCLKPEEAEQPAPALFGATEKTCKFGHFYMLRGRLTAAVDCPDPRGSFSSSIEGTYTATTLDVQVAKSSFLVGQGDYRSTTKVTGRRTGECVAETTAAG